MTKDENAIIEDIHLRKIISKTAQITLKVMDRITPKLGTTIETTRHGITTTEVTTIIDDRITTGNRSRLTTTIPTNKPRTWTMLSAITATKWDTTPTNVQKSQSHQQHSR